MTAGCMGETGSGGAEPAGVVAPSVCSLRCLGDGISLGLGLGDA